MGINNSIKTFILLAVLTALMLFAGKLFGGTTGLIIAGIIVVLFNLASYFWSHKLILFMYKAKEIKEKDQPDLFKIVREVARTANIPMPKVYIVPSEQPNAFATGRNPKNGIVACTTGILKLLNHDELKGVIAHEMSHIKNRDVLIQTVAATIAGVIGFVAATARWAAIFGIGDKDGDSNIVELLLIGILTPIIAMLVQLAISRSREFMADESAARMLHNSNGLASALRKIDSVGKEIPMKLGSPSTSSLFISNPFRGGFFVNILSTHPPIEKRIAALNEIRY
jgi:heat shock protein HtpX